MNIINSFNGFGINVFTQMKTCGGSAGRICDRITNIAICKRNILYRVKAYFKIFHFPTSLLSQCPQCRRFPNLPASLSISSILRTSFGRGEFLQWRHIIQSLYSLQTLSQ